MCEYCYYTIGHHPRCPNASEPKVLGHCLQCNYELREDYEYYRDNDDNKFCSEECAVQYHGITHEWWNNEEE